MATSVIDASASTGSDTQRTHSVPPLNTAAARVERPVVQVEATNPDGTRITPRLPTPRRPPSGNMTNSLILNAAPASGARTTTSADDGDGDGSKKLVSMTEQDLQAVAVIYGSLRTLRGPLSSAEDAEITAAFDAHVQGTMSELAARLERTNDSCQRQIEIAVSKLRLFDICIPQAAAAAAALSSPALSSLLLSVRLHTCPLLSAIPKLAAEMRHNYASVLDQSRQVADASEADAQQVFVAAKVLEEQLAEAQAENKRLHNVIKSELSRERAAWESERNRLAYEKEEQARRIAEQDQDIRHLQTALAAFQNVKRATATQPLPVSTTQPSAQVAPQPAAPDVGTIQPVSSRTAAEEAPELSDKIRQLLFGAKGGQQAQKPAPAARRTTTIKAAPLPANATKSERVQALLNALDQEQPPAASPPKRRAASAEPKPRVRPPTSPASPGGSYGHSVPRALSLKQLHDFIDALFASKARYDARCYANRWPRETLEQHLYTYLNQKFGLKQLVVEHAAALINTAVALAPYDNDAAVFSKMLRNEIDEDFRAIQVQLKETARELLRVQLRESNPTLHVSEVSNLLAQKVGAVYAGVPEIAGPHPADAIGVHQSEWQEIVRYMYSDSDAEVLFRRLNDVILRRTLSDAFRLTPHISSVPVAPQQGSRFETDPPMVSLSPGGAHSPSSAKTSPISSVAVDVQLASDQRITAMISSFPVGEINRIVDLHNSSRKLPWASFLHVLLQFQLEGHDRFLSKFRRIFKEIDSAGTGILTDEQFRRLITSISPMKTEYEIEALLQGADPHGHARVTFSDCVAVISADLASQLQKPGIQQAAMQHTIDGFATKAVAPPNLPVPAPQAPTAASSGSSSAIGSTKRALMFTPEAPRVVPYAKTDAADLKPHPMPVPLRQTAAGHKVATGSAAHSTAVNGHAAKSGAAARVPSRYARSTSVPRR